MASVENKDIERRVGVLEDKDRYNDKRFRKIETAQQEDRQHFRDSIEKINDSLREIERGQHSQELTNQKMNMTLDAVNKERERERELEKESKKQSRKDFKQLRFMMLGTVATLFGSLLLALIRSWLGI